MYQLIKPLLFLFAPERAHHLSTKLFKILLSIPILNAIVKSKYALSDDRLQRTVAGITFPNPVGLAAGFDKDGKYYRTMSALGFGFIEIGTVTPLGQAGNPQPRLFRLPDDKGLINRMGFNNEGVDAMVSRLKNYGKDKLIIGGNIGKNKVTPNEEAYLDYEACFHKLYDLVDYFVVNVSSPNTPDLRSLQDKEPLSKLLAHIMSLRSQKDHTVPVFLKISPNLGYEQIDDVLDIVSTQKVDGLIATNTTITRDGLSATDHQIKQIGNGGLSGLPLKDRALEVVSYIRSKDQEIPIIGVGGICEPQHAIDMLQAGANLVQVYSGLIYSGPSLVKKINKAILSSGLN